jgi:hypothetical protein
MLMYALQMQHMSGFIYLTREKHYPDLHLPSANNYTFYLQKTPSHHFVL